MHFWTVFMRMTNTEHLPFSGNITVFNCRDKNMKLKMTSRNKILFFKKRKMFATDLQNLGATVAWKKKNEEKKPYYFQGHGSCNI